MAEKHDPGYKAGQQKKKAPFTRDPSTRFANPQYSFRAAFMALNL